MLLERAGDPPCRISLKEGGRYDSKEERGPVPGEGPKEPGPKSHEEPPGKSMV